MLIGATCSPKFIVFRDCGLPRPPMLFLQSGRSNTGQFTMAGTSKSKRSQSVSSFFRERYGFAGIFMIFRVKNERDQKTLNQGLQGLTRSRKAEHENLKRLGSKTRQGNTKHANAMEK